MIDVHDSDAESVEKIRKWWSENGKTTVAGLVIGLGGVFGWNGWQSWQQERAESASALYQFVSSSAAEDRLDDVRRHGETLLSEYPDSAYAALTALHLAHTAVAEKQPDEARAHLQWVLDNAALVELKLVARLRLARLALDAGNSDEAWNIVNGADPGKFASLYAAVRGDILLEQGKLDDARKAYEQAIESLTAGNPEYRRLRLKLDNLGTLNVPAGTNS